jgi:large subunit ribosomal protein L24
MIRYNKRNVPVVKGDMVKIMRGEFKGHSNKVANVNTKNQRISIEGLTITKVDGKKVARPIHPSNVLITKLNLTDPWRRRKLEEGLSKEAREEVEREAKEQIMELEKKEEEAVEEVEEVEEEEIEEEAFEEKEGLEKVEGTKGK